MVLVVKSGARCDRLIPRGESNRAQSSYFCFSEIPLDVYPKSALEKIPSRPSEGRWPSSRTLGWDAVDAAASGVTRDGRAGSLGIRERSNGALTNGAAAYGEVVWS